MTQDATITQTAPCQLSTSWLAYHFFNSPAAQVATLPASASINPAQTDNDDPAPRSMVNFPALLVLAKRARTRILDRWSRCI